MVKSLTSHEGAAFLCARDASTLRCIRFVPFLSFGAVRKKILPQSK
jgi:hypothetical protein